MFFKSTLLAIAAALTFATAAQAGETINVHDAYARSSTAKSTSGAVFLVVSNTGPEDDRLIGVRSDAAKRVELHTNIEDANGVMKMIQIEGGIAIPSGGEHALKRGGDHVMLMGLTKGLEDGDIISLTLSFENAEDVTIEVPIDQTRKPGMHTHDKTHNTDG
jgi:copper(I)-binding protein